MNRLTRGGLLALALPTLYGAISLLVPTPGSAALLSRGPGPSPGSIDHPLHLISADFNQDGYDDLVVADFEAGTVSVLINQRDGTFALQKDSPNIVGAAAVGQPTIGPLFLATGDLNPEDVDGDRVNNVVDNCPNVYNPADDAGIQADTVACSISGASCAADADCGTTGGTCRSNGIGDACQTTTPLVDSDQDGVPDYAAGVLDNCPFTPNPGQELETAAGLDGVCGTPGDSYFADDNYFLFGPDGKCGTLDDLISKVGAACSRSNDLIVVNSSSGGGSTLGLVRVRVNDSTGGLLNRFSVQASFGASQAVLADFNGDRRLDLVVSDTGSDALQFYPGADNGEMGVVCLGGGNAGKSCVSSADCPGGTCQQNTVLLMGGLCSGGTLNGMSCTSSANCTGGGTCRLSPLPGLAATCSGGTDPGKTCTRDQDCPFGGICRSPSGPDGLAAADFNGDGLPDLAVANRAAGNVEILLNGGAAAFYPASGPSFPAPDQPVYVLAGPLNGDACADLVVLEQGPQLCRGGTDAGQSCVNDQDCGGGGACLADGTIRTFTTSTANCSVFSLSPVQTIDLGDGHVPRGGVLVDLDGDGNLDLAVDDFVGGQVLLYAGSGTGQFTAFSPLTGLLNPAALVPLNIDSDTGPKRDLAVLSYANGRIDLYRNASSPGNLIFNHLAGSPASRWANVRAMALFPADASPGQDLVLLNNTPLPPPVPVPNPRPPHLDVLSGTGITFRGLPAEPLTGPTSATAMTVADLRANGVSDLLVLDGPGGTATPLVTEPNGVQTERLTFPVGAGPVQAAVAPLILHGADYDLDGVPDRLDNCPTRYNPPGCPANDPINFPRCFVDIPCKDPAKAPVDCVTKDPVTLQCDSDGNGIGDQCQVLGAACENIDTDLDTIPDYDQAANPPRIDNCPALANLNQTDQDQDRVGDACQRDYDHDGVPDRLDNCPTRYNPPGCPANDKSHFPECFVDIPCKTLADSLKGACTLSAAACTIDADCGTTGGTCTVCRNPNASGQCDNDNDGIGDQCEVLDAHCANIDTDQDQVPDYDQFAIPKKIDNCPWVPNTDQSDTDLACSISGASCAADADCGTTGGTCKGNGIGDLCNGSTCDLLTIDSGTCHSGPKLNAPCRVDADCDAPVNDVVVVDQIGGNLSFLVGDASGSLRPAPGTWSAIGGLANPVGAVVGRFGYTCTGLICLGGSNSGRSCTTDADCPGGSCPITTLVCDSNPQPGILVAEKGAPGSGNYALKLFAGDGVGGFAPPGSPAAAQVPLHGDPSQLLIAPDQDVCGNPWVSAVDQRYHFDSDNKTSVIATIEPGVTSAVEISLPSNEGPVPPPANARCAGGTTPGSACTKDADCIGGGLCRSLLPLPSAPADAAFVDLNHDGYLDLVVLSSGDGDPTTPPANITIYMGVGSGLFFTDPSINPTDVPDGMTFLATGQVNLSVDTTYPDLVLFDSVNEAPVILINVLPDRADIDRSGRVDGYDLALLARSFGAERGEGFTIEPDGTLLQEPDLAASPAYSATRLLVKNIVLREGMNLPFATGTTGLLSCDHVLQPTSGLYGLPVDVNLDGKVDGTDLALIASKFGKQVP